MAVLPFSGNQPIGLRAAGANHTNTTDAAALKDSASAAVYLRLPADVPQRGEQYFGLFHALCDDNNANDTLTLVLKCTDGTTTTTLYSRGAFDVSDADEAVIKFEFGVTAIGTGTSAVVRGSFSYTGIEAGSAVTVIARNFSATFDSTKNLDFYWEADWSVAHADNKVKLVRAVAGKVTG